MAFIILNALLGVMKTERDREREVLIGTLWGLCGKDIPLVSKLGKKISFHFLANSLFGLLVRRLVCELSRTGKQTKGILSGVFNN